MPPPETCNSRDDDCDGSVDEGYRARLEHTTYSHLQSLHPQCNGSSERWGANCNSAIHRFCSRDGCTQSGFGPVENSGDHLQVICINGQVIHTTYSALSGHHPSCNGTAERWGANCNAAIHRFCRSIGFESGFGPVENSGGNATIVCARC
ncbi:MAG: hypothetical protein RMJ84_10795 [Sandaracinaceae bacterium]|nr:hypothetical protein [Sandaracinaceae bacterium]